MTNKGIMLGSVSPPKKLLPKEEKVFLSTHQQWDVVEKKSNGVLLSRELHRGYEFKSFAAAFDFMGRAVSELITPQDHHPRWQNTYNRVEVWLTTSDLNGQLSNQCRQLNT